MIESGTEDQFKQSLLGNLKFAPDVDTLKKVKKAFEGQEFKVEAVTVKHYKCGSHKTAVCEWSVVRIVCTSKRSTQGAMAKTLRAVRAARLSLYQFTCQGRHKQDDSFVYDVELREHE